MEIYELRYFLAAAQQQHVHKAARIVHVSPGSVSKAVARLERELRVKLFRRVGRNIRITPEGERLRKKAAELVRLEESARLEVGKDSSAIRVVLCGSEILLSHFGPEICSRIKARYPEAGFVLEPASDRDAVRRIQNGDAHLGLVSGQFPRGLAARELAQVKFRTAAGKGHPLFAAAARNQPVPIRELLKHPFVQLESASLGEVAAGQSQDGWRDDRFPRRFSYSTGSLKTLEALAVSGKSLVYLPDYMLAGLGLKPIQVTGCPFICRQDIRLIARDVRGARWMQPLFQK